MGVLRAELSARPPPHPALSIILQFAFASIIIALTPGPDMTLFFGRALSSGRAAGFACMFGALRGV